MEMNTRGVKTTEFYVALIMLVVWAAKYLGLDAHLTPDNINQVAEAIRSGREQGFDPASLGPLAFVIGRVVLKLKRSAEHAQ